MKTFLSCVLLVAGACSLRAEDPWIVLEPAGKPIGKHVVFVSGDEEYRSEEACPQLAKILAKHHGFKCTVLFAIDPKTGLARSVPPAIHIQNQPVTNARDSQSFVRSAP